MSPLALAVVLAAAPLSLESLGYAPDTLKPAAAEAVVRGDVPYFPVTGTVKALPPTERAAAVKVLASWVKTFVSSPEFKALYLARAAEQRSPPPAPKRPPEVIIKERRAALDEQVTGMLVNLKSLPPDQQAQLKAAAAEMQKAGEAMLKDRHSFEVMEAARFDGESQQYQESLVMFPDDPRAGIKRVLINFLRVTKGIDYGAKLVPQGDRKVFANGDYESKDWFWKMGFRAGKEATEAARAFCEAWLKELP